MTNNELIEELIKIYEEAVQFVEKSEGWGTISGCATVMDGISLRKVQNGICYCSEQVLGVDVSDLDWIKEHQRAEGYWFTTPRSCLTKDGIIKCLKFRLNILKKYI